MDTFIVSIAIIMFIIMNHSVIGNGKARYSCQLNSEAYWATTIEGCDADGEKLLPFSKEARILFKNSPPQWLPLPTSMKNLGPST